MAEKLRLHGLWTEKVEEGLRVCEVALLNAEHKMRERNSTKTAARPGRAGKR